MSLWGRGGNEERKCLPNPTLLCKMMTLTPQLKGQHEREDEELQETPSVKNSLKTAISISAPLTGNED